MKKRPRAFFLILALFVVTFISVLALAFLTGGPLNYRTSLTIKLEQQARWLAHSGIEDARIKLQKDPNFPPPMGPEGIFYSYAEQVTNLGGGATIGSYEVIVDQSRATTPYFLIVLHSTGRIVVQGDEIKRTVRAELDVNPDPSHGPNYYHIVNWSEEKP